MRAGDWNLPLGINLIRGLFALARNAYRIVGLASPARIRAVTLQGKKKKEKGQSACTAELYACAIELAYLGLLEAAAIASLADALADADLGQLPIRQRGIRHDFCFLFRLYFFCPWKSVWSTLALVWVN